MAREKRFDSDSESDHGITAPLGSGAPRPWFPPPPTTPSPREKHNNKRVRVREPAKPIGDLPALPTNAALMPPPAPVDMPSTIRRKPLRGKSVRKTIIAHIEGWWDLELLDKRKTLLAAAGAVAPPVPARA